MTQEDAARVHGDRRSYWSGCRCQPCRDANASDRARWRRLALVGKKPLGTITQAQDAARLVKAILLERWTKQQLAQQAGLERHSLKLKPSQRVRLSTVLRVRRAYRMMMGNNETAQS